MENLINIIKEELEKVIEESRNAAADAKAARRLEKLIKKEVRRLKGVKVIGPVVTTDAVHQGVQPKNGVEYTMIQLTLATNKVRDLGTISDAPSRRRKGVPPKSLGTQGDSPITFDEF